MTRVLTSTEILPTTSTKHILVGRVWFKAENGPCTVMVDGNVLRNLNSLAPTMAGLLEISNLVELLSDNDHYPILGPIDEFLSNGNGSLGSLLAPCDLQPIKAAGVTFVESMLERLVEETAKGDSSKAEEVRNLLIPIAGETLKGVVAGSKKADSVKTVLNNLGLWSQYLEVGLGPYAEIFSKAPPMASIGVGHEIGVNRNSNWNNPEPEMVLAISSKGDIVGATLGNDVNLRDFEGRSALLLNAAKDNNASCAIGPFIRLLDNNFSIENLATLEVSLVVSGNDGFVESGVNPMRKMSRSLIDLVRQTINDQHQYPDGVMLFLGTMFVPSKDRHGNGLGFTHEVGDRVEISAPELGSLINWVNICSQVRPWTFGSLALMRNLADRNLL